MYMYTYMNIHVHMFLYMCTQAHTHPNTNTHRLVTVGKNGLVKIFRSTLENLDAGQQGGGPAKVDEGTVFWVEEQELQGHPQQCCSGALEPSKAAFLCVVGRDNVIRVFSEGVLHGPITDEGLASLQDMRMELGRRHKASTGSLEQVITRLWKVLQLEPLEAR